MDYTVHGILQARILGWVALSFSRWSSQPRDQTQVSCITGRFFTNWATREAQTVWYRPKNKSVEQWNRIESPEINPDTSDQLIYAKWGRNIQGRKHSLFNKLCWENWTATCKRMKLAHSLTLYTKINSKWVKGLNISLDTINLLEENIGRTLFDINLSNIFLDPSPRVMKIEAKINKWDLIKLKSFYAAKKTIKKMKRQPAKWEKM